MTTSRPRASTSSPRCMSGSLNTHPTSMPSCGPRRDDDRGKPSGAALASPAFHAILPLAHPDDRDTLVAWGIADFVARFGFRPEGMWLPETALDLDTLATLARHGIRFTVLMPQQAQRVRSRSGHWTDVGAEQVDPTRPYFVRLPGGGRITVVFGHGPLSRGVAFEGLLDDGTALAAAATGALSHRGRDELVAVVTDGETFGHHHRFGEMALASAVRSLQANGTEVVNIGTWLRAGIPRHGRSSWCTPSVVELRPRCRSVARRLRLYDSRRARLERRPGARRCATPSTGCVPGSSGRWTRSWTCCWVTPAAVIDDYSLGAHGAEAPAEFVARHARGDRLGPATLTKQAARSSCWSCGVICSLRRRAARGSSPTRCASRRSCR